MFSSRSSFAENDRGENIQMLSVWIRLTKHLPFPPNVCASAFWASQESVTV